MSRAAARWMRMIGVFCAAFAALASAAFAGISEFNEAVQRRDYAAAAARAAETWPQLDKTSPNIATIAREFAWIAMLANRPDAAQTYARFLVEEGPRLPSPDPSPAVSRVLYEWSAIAASSTPETRSRLLAALEQRAARQGRDLISIRAAQLLFEKAWTANDWRTSGRAADFALAFLRQVGPEYDVARYRMRLGGIAAGFMASRTPDAYNKMYDLAQEVYGVIARLPDRAQREALASEYFNAAAWGDVIYIDVDGARKGLPNRSLSVSQGFAPPSDLFYPAPGDPGLPRCRLDVDMRGEYPVYPYASSAHGLPGVAVYAVDVLEDGRYGGARLLGSAPHGLFGRALDSALAHWRWKLDGATPAGGCRMPAVQVLTVQFQP